LIWHGPQRRGPKTEQNAPMLKWLVLPMVVFAYLAATVIAAAPRDRDHDRLPARWERSHGLSAAKASARRDPDRDRLTNRRELRHRTHPRAPIPIATVCATAPRSAAPTRTAQEGHRRRRVQSPAAGLELGKGCGPPARGCFLPHRPT
jgi:hypothetical protein